MLLYDFSVFSALSFISSVTSISAALICFVALFVTTDAPEVEFILEYRSPFVTVFFPTENRAVEESFNFACASEHPAKTEKDRRDANNRFLVFFMLVSLTFCTCFWSCSCFWSSCSFWSCSSFC